LPEQLKNGIAERARFSIKDSDRRGMPRKESEEGRCG
jgi:hypothetical protein